LRGGGQLEYLRELYQGKGKFLRVEMGHLPPLNPPPSTLGW